MAEPNITGNAEENKNEQANQSVREVAKKYHVVVTDPASGERLMDTVTDIAIIGAVEREKTVGENVPTKVLWVGNNHQMENLLGLIAKVIGSTMYGRPMGGTMTVGEKPNKLKN